MGKRAHHHQVGFAQCCVARDQILGRAGVGWNLVKSCTDPMPNEMQHNVGAQHLALTPLFLRNGNDLDIPSRLKQRQRVIQRPRSLRTKTSGTRYSGGVSL